MSARLISLNADLRRLRDVGYAIEVRHGYLMIHAVPYVTPDRQIAFGTLVANLDLLGEATRRPDSHQVWFCGQFPCFADGSPLTPIAHSSSDRTLFDGVTVNHHFSNKPPEGYLDYFDKMSRYADIISFQAQAIDPSVTARAFHPVRSVDEESVFRYVDSASSRADIVAVSQKLALGRVAIVGLGGSGAYVLDLVAKTPVGQIHLFDGDIFQQHNAFRAPGAAPFKTLEARPSKVDYWAEIYGEMHTMIVPHNIFMDESTVMELGGFQFVFVCVDRPAVRALVADFLIAQGISFIDVGMDVELLEEDRSLIAACRTTLVTAGMNDHFRRHVNTDSAVDEGIYRSNIQVADLNALNAALAVMKWKKHFGFYQDCFKEHQSVYVVNTHQLTRDEMTLIP